MLELTILALATYRMAHLLAFEEGPFRIFDSIRRVMGQRISEDSGVPYNTTHLSKGATCLWCNSMWFGIVLTVIYAICGRIALMIALPFALSACAIAIDSCIEVLLKGMQEWQ